MIRTAVFQDYLREEKREVNHHGRIRTIGEDGEDLGEGELGGTDVEKTKYLTLTVIFIYRVQKILRMEVEGLHNNWMDDATQKGEISAADDDKMKELKLKMISRQEDVQVRARLMTITGDCFLFINLY